jgi:4-coumarate--CoA ligase
MIESDLNTGNTIYYTHSHHLKPFANMKTSSVNVPEDYNVGKSGEIWARGSQIAMGYLNNPRATEETFDHDGCLHTGDVGHFDHEGFLSITDRLKEMIKVKGIGVAPAELENLLLRHLHINDAAVCGIPDERAGERPKAFVVLKSLESSRQVKAAREILKYIKKNTACYKWLREIEIVSAIPKSPAGKILRRKLRDMAINSSKNMVIKDIRFVAKL